MVTPSPLRKQVKTITYIYVIENAVCCVNMIVFHTCHDLFLADRPPTMLLASCTS